MRVNRLPLLLVMIDPSYFRADVLRCPENKIVGPRPGAADVRVKPHDQVWLFSHKTYTPLVARRLQVPGEISAFDNRDIITIPDVIILLGLHSDTVLSLLLQLGRKPGVVFPPSIDDDCARWLLRPHEHAVHRVSLQPWIVRPPHLRARCAHGGAIQVDAVLRRAVGLFPPTALEPLQRLDAVGRVVLHALEHDDAAAGRLDLGFQNLEQARHAESLDLVLDQQLHRVLEALLHLTNTGGSRAWMHHAPLDQ